MTSPTEAEARGAQTATIAWREHTFEVLAEVNDWPIEATLAYEEGKPATALRQLLGPDQWATFMKTKPTNGDMGEIFDAIAKELGFEGAGE